MAPKTTKTTTKTTQPAPFKLGSAGPASTGTATTGQGASTSATANLPANPYIQTVAGLANQSSGVSTPTQQVDPASTTTGDTNVPEIVVSNPYADPSAWSIQNPALQILTVPGPPGAPLPLNRLIADVATHLGISISGKSQKTLEQLILKKYPGGEEALGPVQQLAKTSGGKSLALWTTAAQNLGLATTKAVTGGTKQNIRDVANQIKGLPSDQISALQKQLYDGGFYSNRSYSDPTSVAYKDGNLDPQTMEAIGTALTFTASYNQQHPTAPLTWKQAIASQDFDVAAGGGIAKLQGGGPNKVPYASQSQLSIPLQTAEESQLGRLPDANDLAKFTQEFQASQAQHAGAALGADTTQTGPDSPTTGATAGGVPDTATLGTEYGTGVTLVPGMPSTANAATEFAQSNDPTQFMAHRFANSYALVLNAMIGDRGMEQALPGYNPNVTNAGSGV